MSRTTDIYDAVNAYRGRVELMPDGLEHLMRFMDLGWVRHLPPAVALTLEGIGDMPRAVIDELVEHERGQQIWEQEPYDDLPYELEMDLQIAAMLHPGVTDREQLARLTAQDRVDAAAHQRACQDRFSSLCNTLGIIEPRTMEEIYPFLLALGVIEEYRRGGTAWVRSLATQLDPIDVLRLDEYTAAGERACRGELRFLPFASALAQQFHAAGGRHVRLATSLLRLARLTQRPVEQLRPCLIGGVDAGILTCDQDLSTVEEHRVFELAIAAGRGEALRNFTAHHRLTA